MVDYQKTFSPHGIKAMFTNNTLSKFAKALSIGNRKRNARKSKGTNSAPAEVLEDRILMTGIASVSRGFDGSVFYLPIPDGASVYGDFDGDGNLDLAEGDSRATIENNRAVPIVNGGQVVLTYNVDGNSTTEILNELTLGSEGFSQAGDSFGAALAVGDFNGDGYDDLAVGVPGEDVNGKSSAGAIHVFYGSQNGLSTTNDRIFHQDSPGVDGKLEDYDRFGFTLTVGNFNGDDYDDLAVGVPAEEIGGDIYAGMVNLFHGSDAGLQSYDSFHQDTPGIEGGSERGDFFGLVMTSYDFNGDGYDDLAVGVPYEDVIILITDGPFPFSRNYDNAGAVNIVYGSSRGLTADGEKMIYQGKDGIAEKVEKGDSFGSALSGGDFDRDGVDDLVVSAPYEDREGSSSEDDVGVVHVLYGITGSGITGNDDQTWDYFSPGISGFYSDTDSYYFGGDTAVGDFNGDGFDDLAITTGAGESGEVSILFGSDTGLQARLEDGAPRQHSNSLSSVRRRLPAISLNLRSAM